MLMTTVMHAVHTRELAGYQLLDNAVKVLISRAQGSQMLKGLFVVDVEISLIPILWSVHALTITCRRDLR